MEHLNGSTFQPDENQKREAKDSFEFKQRNYVKLPQFTIYGENVAYEETSESSRTLPLDTLNRFSRCDSYFMPATGLDFLIGVPEVLLLRLENNMKLSSGLKFLVRIPGGKTLYQGIENSSAVEKALFCSGRNFYMSLLDLTSHEAAAFIRKSALRNIRTCFRQELMVCTSESGSSIGRILQDNTLSAVSFTVFDDKNEIAFKILGSKNSVFGKLNEDVHFSILDPVHRTGGVIIHKWDDESGNFLYQIIFPSCDTSVHTKMLLIGAAMLVFFTKPVLPLRVKDAAK